MWVKPKQGIVLMPEKKFRQMPEEGVFIEPNKYYRRLLRIGDIVKSAKPKKAKPKS